MNKLMDVLVHSLAVIFCEAGNWIIIVVAVINVIVCIRTQKSIKKLNNILHPSNDIVNKISASMQLDNEQIGKLRETRKKLIMKYSLYANITAIFPLLGILGTVAALVTYSNETMMENFMVALSTTLLGVLCAIIFKGIDAGLSGPMDVIIGEADYVIQEHERKEAWE